jgi:chemotaxis protein CheZ
MAKAAVKMEQMDQVEVGGQPIGRAEIAAVVEEILTSMTGDLSLADIKLYHELQELAEFIREAKLEIMELQPGDIRDHHIPMATDELDAVVQATADATGVILDTAEGLERFAGTLPAADRAVISDAVTQIYEACNFQDITGQRISKVVKTLKHIDTTIDRLLRAFSSDGISELPVPPKLIEPVKSEEESLKNGPQLPTVANNQDDIDAILASFD